MPHITAKSASLIRAGFTGEVQSPPSRESIDPVGWVCTTAPRNRPNYALCWL